MPTLQELQQRRKSIQSSQKLTSAMKMVASAKFTQFQKQWAHARENREFLIQNLCRVASELEKADFPLLSHVPSTPSKRTLIILIGADRGLCGGFNSQLTRTFRVHQKALVAQNQEVWVLTSGNRMGDFVEKSGTILLEREEMGVRPQLSQACRFSEKVCTLFLKHEIDACLLIYTQFINALSQKVITYPLLPFTRPFEHSRSFSVRPPLFEPNAVILCEALSRMTLESIVYEALVESYVSEQGARMTAMDNATRNGEEVLKNLNLLYNRQRQSLITNELLEVISGASV